MMMNNLTTVVPNSLLTNNQNLTLIPGLPDDLAALILSYLLYSHHSRVRSVYVLGGSLLDTRSYPLDRPSSSSAGFRFDFRTNSWESICPTISARGSFACAVVLSSTRIITAGGGSRHAMFAPAGSRMSSVEMDDISDLLIRLKMK
ncbi:putative kelch-type beta propeller [Helianthus annuus]|nr:putative kelch-type beta propeller [Helianthus annuus]